MSDFELFIKKLLKKTKLDYLEKVDLENELIEHLNSMKDEYMKQGISEKVAIDKAIKDFKEADFKERIKEFSKNKKLSGINIPHILKINLILILTYFILMTGIFTLFREQIHLNVAYFLVISFVLFLNYYYTSGKFILKKDAILNVSITCFVFFIIQSLSITILANIYKALSTNLNYNINNLYVFDLRKFLVYIILSVITILLTKYCEVNPLNLNLKLSNLDLTILILGVILTTFYFVYPNKFYLLNLIIYKMFKIDVKSFSKNLFYMNINENFIVVNIGLIILIIFVLYKFITQITKKNLTNNKNI